MILLRLFPPAAMALVWRLAIVLAGAFAVYVVWTSPPMELPSTAPAPRPARQTHTGDASKATMASVTQTYPEIAERPLFYPSRKAWAPATAAASAGGLHGTSALDRLRARWGNPEWQHP